MNECIIFLKKSQTLQIVLKKNGFQLARAAPVLIEAGNKPSTRFLPEELVELYYPN